MTGDLASRLEYKVTQALSRSCPFLFSQPNPYPLGYLTTWRSHDLLTLVADLERHVFVALLAFSPLLP